MLAGAFAFLTNLSLLGLAIGAALPGPHRILWPEAYGLSEIAPRVWTDTPERATEFLALAGASRNSVIAFFGDIPPQPGLVFCATSVCADNFGIGGNGLSLADVAVMVSPGGLTQGTLTHEMTHSRLHRKMGLRNIVRQPYPTWFDEGLATHVADHPRWPGEVTREARRRILEVRYVWQWDDAYRELGTGLAYRAAAAEVAAIERQAGRDGLLELIARAEAGQDFETVLSDVLGD